MNDTNYSKGSCLHCGSHIEFPETAEGSIVNCPHCGLPTELRQGGADRAPAKEETATIQNISRLGLIGAVCGLILVLAAIIVFVHQHQQAKTLANQQSASLSSNAPTSAIAATPTNAPVAQPDAKPPKSLTDLKVGDIQLEKAKGSSLVYAVGTLENSSEYQRFGVRIELDLINHGGAKVGTAQDYKAILEPHNSWQFRALVTDPKAVSARLGTLKEED